MNCVRISTYLATLLLAETLAAQIVTQNGGVTSPEIPTLRESVTFQSATDLESLHLDHRFFYGVTPSFELAVAVPTILNQRVEFPNAAGANERKRFAGLGDITLTLKKSIYQVDMSNKSKRKVLSRTLTLAPHPALTRANTRSWL